MENKSLVSLDICVKHLEVHHKKTNIKLPLNITKYLQFVQSKQYIVFFFYI